MARFADLLNKPLSSKTEEPVKESFEDETINDGSVECGDNPGIEDGDDSGVADDIKGIVDDSEDDIDGLTDDDLAALDSELSGSIADDLVADDDIEVDNDDLSPEDEMEADDMMSLAATTMLVKDELNAQERADFVTNEAAIAVNESFMTASDVISLKDNSYFTEAKYNNRMRIQLNKDAKLKQLRALAVLIRARQTGDPDFVKYKKATKVKKLLFARMARKHGTKADKMAKVYLNRLMKSKSPTLSKIGSKFAS